MLRRLACALLFFVVGCVGAPASRDPFPVAPGDPDALHRQGEDQLGVHLGYGSPVRDRPWPSQDPKGNAPNAAVTVTYNAFVLDRLAISGALTPYRYYDQSDGAAHAAELQGGLRWFPWNFRVGSWHAAFFLDSYVGATQTTPRSVPEDGTHTNITFDFGGGFEMRPRGWERATLLLGYRMRHLSNGQGGDDPDNPSQNDDSFVIGMAWRW